MRKIGQTNDDGFLVELTRSEFESFCRLHDAFLGKEFHSYYGHERDRLFEDVSKMFEVIASFVWLRFRFNELEHAVTNLKKLLTEDNKSKESN